MFQVRSSVLGYHIGSCIHSFKVIMSGAGGVMMREGQVIRKVGWHACQISFCWPLHCLSIQCVNYQPSSSGLPNLGKASMPTRPEFKIQPERGKGEETAGGSFVHTCLWQAHMNDFLSLSLAGAFDESIINIQDAGRCFSHDTLA